MKKHTFEKPIKIEEYAFPWYFQLALLQNQDAVAGFAETSTQINYAIGLNLAVTFSDPSTWPEGWEE